MLIIKGLLIFIHLLISAVLVFVILQQAPKGGGLSGSMFGGGGGGASTLFGARSAASMLSNITKYLAVAFLAISLVISLITVGSEEPMSVTQKVLATQGAQLPPVESLDIGSGTDIGGTPIGGESSEEGVAVDPASPASDQEGAEPLE
ncbi:MAG: preprotein translocase subunit SecG [Candidatus Electryoneaceae bacterium]|nr:preprotein translocase subunit SecG [Candidatus Electryoneaceae bacterium]